MKITIDLDILIQEFITPDDFVFLWGLYTKYDLNAIENYPNFIPLEEKGLIKIGEDYMLTEQGKKLFEPKGVEQKFLEFWTSYPMKVRNGHGYRALRDSGSDTKQAGICLKKYEAILKRNPNIHKTIMTGLHNYVKNSNLAFLVGIEVFLNQEMWNKYIEIEEGKKEDLGTTQSI